MRLDAHQHFWAYDAEQYPWIPPGSPLQRDWLPVHLAAEQARAGFDGSVAVQARQSLEETRWLLSLAKHASCLRAVVGWVDLRTGDVEETLTVLAQNPKFVGVRHVVQDEPDPRFLLQPEFVRGLGQLREFGLTYDLLIYPHQLPAAIELAQLLPEQPFVLDHMAKPPVCERLLSPWREGIRELARSPNVHCKISGLVTEADHRNWQPADFAPYFETVLEAFGPGRLMFGSDWPVCLFAASYGRVTQLAEELAHNFDASQRAAFFGGNAARVYRVPQERP